MWRATPNIHVIVMLLLSGARSVLYSSAIVYLQNYFRPDRRPRLIEQSVVGRRHTRAGSTRPSPSPRTRFST